ncbi:MAG: type II toxin-antitoxin system VapC family toxin [Candidatus Thorarchaeota archaeon]|nr:type II toxin-antitoxin system VapC family toxin [Candidatus Thorarchaeota archaeon]
MKKYGVSYNVTIDFIEEIIAPYTDILPLGLYEYRIAKDAILQYGFRPSDALHFGTMQNHDVTAIVTEDSDFDIVAGIDII